MYTHATRVNHYMWHHIMQTRNNFGLSNGSKFSRHRYVYSAAPLLFLLPLALPAPLRS
jgi:hypothetical protein